MLAAWLLTVALAGAEPALDGPDAPSDHTLIYYNARLALREDQPLEATKLWLLRNALEDHTGTTSPYDEDFRTVTWAALGELGICQDGHPGDEDGAGLWPIALHNWLMRNRSRRTRSQRPKPFEAFEVGRQARFFSIGDVLSADELKTVRLHRGACYRPLWMLLDAGESLTAELSDRQVAARLTQYLLHRGERTLDPALVRGSSVIEARLFDVNLQLAALAAREARQKERQRGAQGRILGLSRESVVAMREDEPAYTFDADSEPARILEASALWPADEWMALTPDRRLFLYDHAKAWGKDPEPLRQTALEVIDALIDRAEGEEVERWIAHRSEDPADQQAIWGGERGERLLALDRESGFQERSVIALHRGVWALQTGDLPGSMRALAYALQYAPESRKSDEVRSLSLRWLTYVASQFEITDELLITLQELVPRREYGILLEDLMWGAAFRADLRSFERGERNQASRGALERRLELLRPLAAGDVGRFTSGIRAGLERSPSETLRFLDQLVQRLELEDSDVRRAQIPTLNAARAEVAHAIRETSGSQARSANTFLDRSQAILEGLGAIDRNSPGRDRAHSLGPSGEVYAGSVRLAPSDPLPWPFRATEVTAPSIFEPIHLIPVEWQQDGKWVFGWRLEG